MDWLALVSKFIEVHFKKALVVFLVMVAGAGLFIYRNSAELQNEKKSFDKLSTVIRTYKEKKEKFREALETEGKESDSENPEKKKKLSPPSGDLDQDYGDEVTKLEEFLKDNSGHSATAEAALILSEIYSKYRMKDKAVQAMEFTLKSWPNKNLLYHIMQMRLGNLWATMTNGCEQALSHWKIVGESEIFMAVQAQMKMAICFWKIGKFQEAGTWFEKVQTDSPQSPEAANVKRYLRFLKFQSQRKEEKKTKTDEENKRDQTVKEKETEAKAKTDRKSQ